MKRPKFLPSMAEIDRRLDTLQDHGKSWIIGAIALGIIACWALVGFSPHDNVLLLITVLVTIVGILVTLRVIRGSLHSYNNREEEDEALVPSERVKKALAKSRKGVKGAQENFSGEVLLWESREHPISLWPWFIGGAALLAAVVFVAAMSLKAALVLLLAGMVVFGCRLLAWHLHRICVTDKRLLVVTGIIDIRYKTMPLSKLTDQTAGFPPISNILAWLRIIRTQYATLTVESAGQDQALREVLYVPEGHKVNRLIMSMVL
ncbi:MAG TPA: PH domain-containing protein [Candidatus Saccharimonadales bacterium]|nr:PH domain-containing protein [Candidatus Saccharimonadales bacterium]